MGERRVEVDPLTTIASPDHHARIGRSEGIFAEQMHNCRDHWLCTTTAKAYLDLLTDIFCCISGISPNVDCATPYWSEMSTLLTYRKLLARYRQDISPLSVAVQPDDTRYFLQTCEHRNLTYTLEGDPKRATISRKTCPQHFSLTLQNLPERLFPSHTRLCLTAVS